MPFEYFIEHAFPCENNKSTEMSPVHSCLICYLLELETLM